MNELREIKGIWFLPETPEIEIGGVLTYEPGKTIRLELIGDLSNRAQFHDYFDSSGALPVIFGISTEGKKVSLYDCHGSWKVRVGAIPSTQYSANAFVEGMHLADREAKLFSSVEVNFVQLLSWIGRSAYEMSREKVNNTFYRTNIEYSPDNSFKVGVDIEPGFNLSLGVSAIATNTLENCIVENKATATIRGLNSELSIWELVRRMEIFRTFLSLGLLQTVPYTNIFLCGNGKQINFTFLERGENYSETKSKPFLFNYGRIQTQFDTLLKNWYNSTGDMFPIRVHLLNAILPRSTFHSTDFMIIAFALEGFYHRFLKVKLGAKGDLRGAISDILRIFKDLSFIKLIHANPEIVNESRNYYAHLYLKDSGKKILSGIELLKLSEKLKVLLVLSILKQMGFDMTLIEQCVSHSDLLKTVNSF